MAYMCQEQRGVMAFTLRGFFKEQPQVTGTFPLEWSPYCGWVIDWNLGAPPQKYSCNYSPDHHLCLYNQYLYIHICMCEWPDKSVQ